MYKSSSFSIDRHSISDTRHDVFLRRTQMLMSKSGFDVFFA